MSLTELLISFSCLLIVAACCEVTLLIMELRGFARFSNQSMIAFLIVFVVTSSAVMVALITLAGSEP